jgi:hypothetical protein
VALMCEEGEFWWLARCGKGRYLPLNVNEPAHWRCHWKGTGPGSEATPERLADNRQPYLF